MNHKTKLNLIFWILMFALSAAITSCSVGDNTPPSPIEDLSLNSSTRQLSWTATGDDEHSGKAIIYDLRFFQDTEVASLLGLTSLDGVAFSTIEKTVQENFSNATHVEGLPAPNSAGTPETFLLPRIDTTGTKNFFFALDVRDEVGNNSGPSNVVEAQTPMVPTEIRNSASGSCFGKSVGIGDFNGIVNTDLNPFSPSATPSIIPSNRIEGIAIGDPCLGRVYIFFGGKDLSGNFDASAADVTIIGNAGDLFGASVTGLGNVGGDPSDDLAIGAPAFNNGTGEVFIIFGSGKWKHGSPVTIDLTNGAKPNILITGENAGDKFGTATVRLEGGSSIPVLIGAPGADSGKGRAYYIFLKDINQNTSASQAKAIFFGESAGGMFGLTLANTGDFDADGFFDFAVGAPLAGKVYIFFGQTNITGQDLSKDKSNVLTISGNPADGFGSSISGIGSTISGGGDTIRGDINGDSKPDFIVGAPGSNNNTGSVFLYSGADIASAKTGGAPNFITQFTGVHPGDKFGTSVSILGDINPQMTTHKQTEFTVLLFNPTNADFAVGAPGTSGGTGTVYLFFGRNDFQSTVVATGADLTLNGNSGEEFGRIVMGTGNITEDLINDLAVAGSGLVRAEF